MLEKLLESFLLNINETLSQHMEGFITNAEAVLKIAHEANAAADLTFREYECFWGVGYANVTSGVERAVKKLNDFTTDIGYDQDNFDAIVQLQLGQAYTTPDPLAIHVVVRIK